MVRFVLAAALVVALVSLTSATQGYQKKLFMKYAMNNMFAKCIGQEALDKFVFEYIKASKRCHNREFSAELKPVYIKPYPVDGGENFYNNRYPTNRNIPYHQHQGQQYQQYQQPPFPQYQQQQPQYQQQQYQQPQYQQQQQYRQQQQYGYQQPQQFYGPGFGFQPIPNNNVNQVNNRQVRAANKNKVKNVQNVQAETNVAGEAELYYYNKLKHHMTNKVGNFSCIMHELGYFTEDNQVDLQRYKQAYQNLSLPTAMKEEFIQNIDICQEVSECLPDKCFAKYPYGLEYGRSFFFVMCEKKKAMEVCLKKQMIDDYYKYKDHLAPEEMADDMETEEFFSMGF